AKLKWFVIRDMVETEPVRFWRDSAEIERGELKTEEIETEVFFFPAAGHAEKEGAFTNTQRLLQWREKAVEPPGDSRSDAWFIHQLALRLIAKARASDDPIDEPLRALNWWFPEDKLGEPKMEAVLAEINGWKTEVQSNAEGILFGKDREGRGHHGPQVADYNELKADGSTACGAWIYSGVFNRDGVNKANKRQSKDYLGHGWGFSWPSDRRIIYNRASAKPNGEPWSECKKLVWWDSEKWTGIDVPDFKPNKPPNYRPQGDEAGLDGQRGDAPFILHEDGLGWMFVEISPQLASELKISNSDYVCLVSLRGAIEARALVSRRIRPMNLNGKTVHQVAIPFHFGAAGPLRGNAANNLVAISGEPNVTIMESKALLCNIIPGRLPRGPDFLAWIERYAPQSGQPPNLHPEQQPLGAPSGGKFSSSHGKEGKTV